MILAPTAEPNTLPLRGHVSANFEVNDAVRRRKCGLRGGEQCRAIQVVSVRGHFEEIEVLRRVEQLNVRGNSFRKRNLAVGVVNRLLVFEKIELDQVD
jgi:hypothetical protein